MAKKPTPFLDAAKGGTTTVRMEGLEELDRKLRRLPAEASGAALLSAVMDGAEIVRETASTLAPRRTGTLADNIGKQELATKKEKVEVGVGHTEEAWYGIFAEIGTSDSPAQPFLRPALDETRASVVAEISDALEAGILKLARSG